ncbi:BgTH12-01484 [Blumeria graminis f. sp. triticale]|uniref:BgtA-20062 n=3 Tax=Blumeria graminis TaxID=34373 RepID=A0A9X9MEP9_BLUGR|nr:hypothetical protein BGT96224_A20062 [Blumeria graminis f. sp. tritici 96224]CAD6501231.1 BgTH12-01484 [Blumeria graminis f. sp. triticale]VDB83647.1 BgtA-20062 [Blumeria graminis f. sp. tritici]
MSISPHRPQLDVSLASQNGPSRTPRLAPRSPGASSNGRGSTKNMDPSNQNQQDSNSSRNTLNSTNTRINHKAVHQDVRALPSWIKTYEEDDDSPFSNTAATQINPPSRTHIADHHYTTGEGSRRVSQDGYIDTHEDTSKIMNEKKSETGFFSGYREPVKGRKWDHARDGEPVIVQAGVPNNTMPWRTYITKSIPKVASDEEGTIVDEGFLLQQTPGYMTPWRGDLENANDPETLSGLLHSKRQRKTLMKRIRHHLLMHPLVPLLFRITVLATSVNALGIATSVHHLSKKYHYEQTPSSTMAIMVDVIAIPYILYITWDEYTGKPLGLRSPGAKIRLVLLDLFFIIFESANLALAFGALTSDNGSCQDSMNGTNYIICNRVKALCGILMVALYAWSITFAISIFRLVQRVGGKEEE